MPLNFVSFSAKGDPLWDKVVLLITGDSANGSPTFTDVKGHAITRLGNPLGDATRKAPGGNSIRYATKGDALSIANSSDFDLLGKDFTLESFNQFDVLPGGGVILGRWGIGPGTSADYILLYNGASKLEWVGGGIDLQSSALLNDGKMHHFCAERYNNVMTLYFDGAIVGQIAMTINVANSGGRPLRTCVWDDAANSGYVGNQAQIRFTVGEARYKGQAFAIPKAAYPVS